MWSMDILVIAPRFPYPTRTGDTLTIFHLLKYLHQRHAIDLVACTSQEPIPEHYDVVAPYCRNLVTVPISRFRRSRNAIGGVFGRRPLQADWFYSPDVACRIERLVRQYRHDVLYAHTIRTARYVQELRVPLAALRILAMQISMELNYRRLARFERNLLYRLIFRYEADRLGTFEQEVAKAFDHALVISDVDRAAICGGREDPRFFECPHGVSLDDRPFDAGAREPKSIVFSGNMNYRPNVDAATFFVQVILPRIHQRVPDAVFYIVGANPTVGVRELGRERGVTVTGEVESVYTWLRRAAVGVNPLRAGAGLQNKVLEGMACGLPMVVSPVANEGIKAVSGTHLLVEESAAAFSDSVSRLLLSAEERRALGGSARRFIEDNWSWDVHFSRLEEFLELRVSSRST